MVIAMAVAMVIISITVSPSGITEVVWVALDLVAAVAPLVIGMPDLVLDLVMLVEDQQAKAVEVDTERQEKEEAASRST